MKRLTIIILTLAIHAVAHGQQGLRVSDVFEGHVIPQQRMVETRVRGKTISKYRLTFYRSVRFKCTADEASRVLELVEADRQPGLSHYDALVPLPPQRSHTVKLQLPSKGSTRRYLCYQERWQKKKGEREVTLVYMEGTLESLDELNAILNQ